MVRTVPQSVVTPQVIRTAPQVVRAAPQATLVQSTPQVVRTVAPQTTLVHSTPQVVRTVAPQTTLVHSTPQVVRAVAPQTVATHVVHEQPTLVREAARAQVILMLYWWMEVGSDGIKGVLIHKNYFSTSLDTALPTRPLETPRLGRKRETEMSSGVATVSPTPTAGSGLSPTPLMP